MPLPSEFLDRLKLILPQDKYDPVVGTFSASSPTVLRVNTLKAKTDQVFDLLHQEKIRFEFSLQAFYTAILHDPLTPAVQSMIDAGKIYQQSLSSMLPVIILAPKKGERILDMCAAPGSKTSQMAMLMENSGEIVALENARPRYYRLKAVLELLGVTNTKIICKDARLYQDNDLFDAVLADVPCSSEGRFSTEDPKSYAYWSARKIKEMQHKQKGLLLSASRLVKSGGRLVYSTCTFAPEENEGVIDWFLKKAEASFSVEKIFLPNIASYPAILSWGKKAFDPEVSKCLRVLPNQAVEGFFIAYFKRQF